MYFWPKNGQNSQNKNFPRHNTAIRWFKVIVPRFRPSFRQIWCVDSKKMSKNLIFGLKMAKYGKNWPFLAKILKTRFFSKIRLEHFFSLAKMQLCAKFQKNLMRGSPDIVSRTDARTHKRESIGPSANAERPINEKRAIWGTLPWGANENFLAHSTETKSLRSTISNICSKIIKIWCTVLKI